ncbi:alpha/beta fold hydrolase [Nocardioides sp. SYSU DS0651]|uniref:alpha/beta fold hydrolase n=1 Tax=Nocardioides sp. SYSU DS0651 TaxID=3415955 RepID=UPI003F4C89F1
MQTSTISDRLNVHVAGPEGGRPVVFAHGFGCDQTMWRHVAPHFTDRYRTVLFDYVGAGGSDLSAWDPDRYSTLDGYAGDLVALLDELDLRDAVIVGHSVSAMIGAMAQVAAPDRVTGLVLVAPSPRYLNDGDYVGGFTPEQVDGLLAAVAKDFTGWSQAMAPVIVGNPDRPALGEELTAVFCRMDPAMALAFARATFLSDTRDLLPRIDVPTLVLQCRDDAIAPESVGRHVAARIREARLVLMQAAGHCPNLSAPLETTTEIEAFLARL